MQKVTFSWRNFCELSLQELYAVLKLRSEVFVVEQKCVYLDLDDHDQDARHLLVTDKGVLVAYLRVQPPTEHHQSAKIQRLVVDPRFRNKGLGHRVISEALEQIHQTFGQIEVEASAQTNWRNSIKTTVSKEHRKITATTVFHTSKFVVLANQHPGMSKRIDPFRAL